MKLLTLFGLLALSTTSFANTINCSYFEPETNEIRNTGIQVHKSNSIVNHTYNGSPIFIGNNFNNCVKGSESTSQTVVRCESVNEANQVVDITVTIDADGNGTEFTVFDNRPGMNSGYIPKINPMTSEATPDKIEQLLYLKCN